MTKPTTSDIQAAYVAHTGTDEAAAEFDQWLHAVTVQVADGVTRPRFTGKVTEDFAAGALAIAQVNRVTPTQNARWDRRITDPRYLNPNHENWVGMRTEVIARTSDGAEWGRGTVIAYTDRPTLIIEREDGTRFSWIADLCTPAAEEAQR